MRYLDEFRDPVIINELVKKISREASAEYCLMEVCGSHTHAIRKHGIHSLLPDSIHLLSGPGCPVCVTPTSFIDLIVQLALKSGFIVASYGDLIRVPGSKNSLQECREEGADVRMIYSSLEALSIAASHPDNNIIFPAIGFETTAPSTAIAIKMAEKNRIHNFFVLSAHKIMPPAMHAVIQGGTKVDGYICPGHVSTITGSNIYEVFPSEYGVAAVISGFEPVDILLSVLMLIRQINQKKYRTEIQYTRAVHPEGNLLAQNYIREVFEMEDVQWRGLGILPLSGLKIAERFQKFNAFERFSLNLPDVMENPACICGDILKGLKKPDECVLFGAKCSPRHPVGACMVSSEGACNAWNFYKSTTKQLNTNI